VGITQLSKIQVRGGLQIDLPGAPTSTSPLVFSQPLDPGEFAFTTDTGRLFIGFSPTVGQPNYQRTAFPYQNIEILTENSTDVLKNVMGSQLKELSSPSYYYQASLQASVASWQDIQVNQASGPATAYVFSGSTLLCSIEYWIYSITGDPIRQGLLHVLQDSISAEAQIIESRVTAISTTIDDDTDPVDAEANVQFRIYRSGSGTDQTQRFSYMNNLPVQCTMFFRVSRPVPTS
jgi:hypothetical protein